MLSFAKIVLLCIAASVLYGVAHDQITARVCPEYFTIGHPPVFRTDSPTLLGLAWGIYATWWAGAVVGLMLAGSARFGGRRRTGWRELARPVTILMAVMAGCAVLFGIVGYFAARQGLLSLEGTDLGNAIEPAKHAAFIADGCAHNASYSVGFIGGVVLCVRTWRKRKTEG